MTGILKRKVVVISGVGPGLGTTLAHRCARDGADLVLAARTLERLEGVAKEITGSGHKALAVRTDITDDDAVNSLVEATVDAYGKVDVLINNAFRVPSMKPLAGTTFQHIRDAIELSALGALRLIQAFTPALEKSAGSIVNVNSMVLRHSQAKYGAYKMAKSALLSGREGHSRQFRCTRLHLGRHVTVLLRASGRQIRHHGGPDLPGHRGELRSQAAAHRGRGGFGDPVHGQ
jgi:NAD(P)-dependent dehydrogenase (short-subunit alcohol dehydrogenase family)